MVTSTREMKEENMCDLEVGMARVKEALENDYAEWCGRSNYPIGEDFPKDADGQARLDAMLQSRYNVIFKEGRNYIKVIRSEDREDSGKRESVVGFIVKKASKGFQVGDILKAASWQSPAMNFARGHVEDENLKLCWAGI